MPRNQYSAEQIVLSMLQAETKDEPDIPLGNAVNHPDPPPSEQLMARCRVAAFFFYLPSEDMVIMKSM